MKVLIVDDVRYSRYSVKMLLERAGHKAIDVESGRKALSALQNDHAIQVVITDLMMPGMDGIDLFTHAQTLERVGDQGQIDSPPFILLSTADEGRWGTSKAATTRLELAGRIGFTQVLTKPVDQELLLRILERIETKERRKRAEQLLLNDQ